MEHIALRVLFIGVGVLAGYLIIRAIASFSQGKVAADLYAAVNVFLYAVLGFNVYFGLSGGKQDVMGLITAGVVVVILLFRVNKTGRWV